METADVIESWVPAQEEIETLPPKRMTFRQIADDLEDRIRRGQYPAGQYIPSYKKIAEMYDVSIATAGKAVALLADRGLIEEDQGRGNFVRNHPD